MAPASAAHEAAPSAAPAPAHGPARTMPAMRAARHRSSQAPVPLPVPDRRRPALTPRQNAPRRPEKPHPGVRVEALRSRRTIAMRHGVRHPAKARSILPGSPRACCRPSVCPDRTKTCGHRPASRHGQADGSAFPRHRPIRGRAPARQGRVRAHRLHPARIVWTAWIVLTIRPARRVDSCCVRRH